MADTNRRVPLWLIALVAGMGVISLAGVFLYGSYSGLGSSL
jgi:photosystem II PsbJ protein